MANTPPAVTSHSWSLLPNVSIHVGSRVLKGKILWSCRPDEVPFLMHACFPAVLLLPAGPGAVWWPWLLLNSMPTSTAAQSSRTCIECWCWVRSTLIHRWRACGKLCQLSRTCTGCMLRCSAAAAEKSGGVPASDFRLVPASQSRRASLRAILQRHGSGDFLSDSRFETGLKRCVMGGSAAYGGLVIGWVFPLGISAGWCCAEGL
jgi:hypothetical protein